MIEPPALLGYSYRNLIATAVKTKNLLAGNPSPNFSNTSLFCCQSLCWSGQKNPISIQAL